MVVEINIFIIYAIFLGIGNVIFSSSQYLGIAFSLFQIFISYFLLLRKKYDNSVVFTFISLVLGLSYDMGMGQFTSYWYTLKTIKIAGINIGFLMLLPYLVLALVDRKVIFKIRRDSDILTKIVKSILVINIISVIVGFINVFIFNDNNVRFMDGYISNFIGEIYIPVLVTIIPAVIFYWRSVNSSSFIGDLKTGIIATYVGMVFSIITSLISGLNGFKFDTLIVWATVAGAFLPYAILFPFYGGKKILKVIFGVLCLICGITFFSNGKMYVTFIILVIPSFFMLFKRYNRKLLFGLIVVVGVGLIAYEILGMKLSINRIMNSKINYAIRFMNVFSDNWFEMIPPSPKWRLIELIDITKEYLHKPYYFILGKGILGTIPDYTGYFSRYMWNTANASIGEWSSGIFYSMHETINKLYLNCGLMGIIQILFVTKSVIKYFRISPYVLIGGIWYLLYYGYSFTIAVFGSAALIVGFYEVKKYLEKNEKSDNLKY